jgi:hypothetical protein
MRARVLVLCCCLVMPIAPARAESPGGAAAWAPVRIHLACQSVGRTRACPAFLRGFIDETPLLAPAPRARAQVLLHVNVTYLATEDLVHLRFTSSEAGMPASIEVVQPVDSRASDDDQRAALRPAFLRGVAAFVAAKVPSAVQVTLSPPDDAPRAAVHTTPWGFAVWAGAWGSFTGNYRAASGWGGVSLSRLTDRALLALALSGNRDVTRQPPLVVDGEPVSLDLDAYGVTARARAALELHPAWSVGLLARGGHQDVRGQYRLTGRAHVGLSRDWFPSDDPRGNALAVAYLVGYQYDRYNTVNTLDQRRARFASHGVLVQGTVRRDRLQYHLRASAMAQVSEPRTRYVLDLSPQLSTNLGDHVDLELSLGLTRQAVPGPRAIDQDDFGAVTRASYAEPLRLQGSIAVRLYWDRTNPDRNNRFSLSSRLSDLGAL